MDKKGKVSGGERVKRFFLGIYETLWYHSNVIILAAVLTGVCAFVTGKFLIIPTYESTAKLAIFANEEEEELSEEEIRLNVELAGDYVELVTTRSVVGEVIQKFQLGMDYKEYLDKLEVVCAKDSHIVSVTVRDADPELAKKMLDEICYITKMGMKAFVTMDVVHIIDEGRVAEVPTAPNVLRWTVAGIILGYFGAIVFVLLRDLFDEMIRSPEDIEKYLQLDTLAVIPLSETESKAGGDEEEA